MYRSCPAVLASVAYHLVACSVSPCSAVSIWRMVSGDPVRREPRLVGAHGEPYFRYAMARQPEGLAKSTAAGACSPGIHVQRPHPQQEGNAVFRNLRRRDGLAAEKRNRLQRSRPAAAPLPPLGRTWATAAESPSGWQRMDQKEPLPACTLPSMTSARAPKFAPDDGSWSSSAPSPLQGSGSSRSIPPEHSR